MSTHRDPCGVCGTISGELKVAGFGAPKIAEFFFCSRGSAPHPAGAPAPDPGWGSRPRPRQMSDYT